MTSAPGATGSPAAPPAVGAPAVAIQNFAFSPATITVKVGTAVTWTNKDSEPHTVTTANGPLHSDTSAATNSTSFATTSPA